MLEQARRGTASARSAAATKSFSISDMGIPDPFVFHADAIPRIAEAPPTEKTFTAVPTFESAVPAAPMPISFSSRADLSQSTNQSTSASFKSTQVMAAPVTQNFNGLRQMTSSQLVSTPSFSGVKEMLTSAREVATPKLTGVKDMFALPVSQPTPNFTGIRRVFSHEHQPKTPNMTGFKSLFRAPSVPEFSPQLDGLKSLLWPPTPSVVRATIPRSFNFASAPEPAPMPVAAPSSDVVTQAPVLSHARRPPTHITPTETMLPVTRRVTRSAKATVPSSQGVPKVDRKPRSASVVAETVSPTQVKGVSRKASSQTLKAVGRKPSTQNLAGPSRKASNADLKSVSIAGATQRSATTSSTAAIKTAKPLSSSSQVREPKNRLPVPKGRPEDNLPPPPAPMNKSRIERSRIDLADKRAADASPLAKRIESKENVSLPTALPTRATRTRRVFA